MNDKRGAVEEFEEGDRRVQRGSRRGVSGGMVVSVEARRVKVRQVKT